MEEGRVGCTEGSPDGVSVYEEKEGKKGRFENLTKLNLIFSDILSTVHPAGFVALEK